MLCCIVVNMRYTIVGLGNPKQEYVHTRHNIGADLVDALEDKLPKGGKVERLNVYMNNSGGAVKKLIKSKKAAEALVVVHDDLDLPLGKVKISFGSSAGGHRGVKSIQAAIKTQDFIRVRVGISPSTPGGKIRKPDGDDTVDFVLGKFKPTEAEKLKKVKKLVGEALELIVKSRAKRPHKHI
jgi:PTH1 family peptidyl-tRNA hydrolase